MRRRLLCCLLLTIFASTVQASDDDVVRVFIFAGQSNMEGADSKVQDIKRFPPFHGLEAVQDDVRFAYCIGRDKKERSEGWVSLQSVRNMVGPELSFARQLKNRIDAPIAIIKVAAGGTHLGGDWNPNNPSGFKMYPLALDFVRSSLADFDKQGIKYRLEGFMWHQGENDMFNAEYQKNYGVNLKNFIACWRRDLNTPKLPFYIGELCTKSIWGMDLRPRMYAISLGQKSVTEADPLATYVPTSHVGVEIGNPVGLHYHYGTLGQLEHGENYADAYLRSQNAGPLGGMSDAEYAKQMENEEVRARWEIKKVKLFVLAGHRNMEGERAFVQDLEGSSNAELLKVRNSIPFCYSIGGGVKRSPWGPLRPDGFYDTFGPELSFGNKLFDSQKERIAIAKFTHSGSQMIDWTPEGSMAKSRHIYPAFIQFIKDSINRLKSDGIEAELAGIFYHVGENEMSMHQYRKQASTWLQSFIEQSRRDLNQPELRWFVSQQPPTDHKSVNNLDVVADIAKYADSDPNTTHIKLLDLPEQEKRLVIDTRGIVWLGERLAAEYAKTSK